MFKLMVFDKHREARHVMRRLAEDVGSAATYRDDQLVMQFKSGEIIKAAIIASDRDVHRYRGLPINEVQMRAPASQYVMDHLAAMTRPEI